MASRKPDSLVSDVGNWVDGERFWGREVEVESLIQQLRDGANLVISAPRRVGKTSLMREVARRTEGEFLSIHVDLQAASSPADLVVQLALASRSHRKLFQKVTAGFRNLLDSVGKLEEVSVSELAIRLRGATGSDWQVAANRLVDEFAGHEPRVIIYFDELAILIQRLLKDPNYAITSERIREVDQLMSWLRQATIRHARKLGFVIASSIGLAPVLAQARLSATLNTFTIFELPPWPHDTAIGALLALAKRTPPRRCSSASGSSCPTTSKCFGGCFARTRGAAARRSSASRMSSASIEACCSVRTGTSSLPTTRNDSR